MVLYGAAAAAVCDRVPCPTRSPAATSSHKRLRVGISQPVTNGDEGRGGSPISSYGEGSRPPHHNNTSSPRDATAGLELANSGIWDVLKWPLLLHRADLSPRLCLSKRPPPGKLRREEGAGPRVPQTRHRVFREAQTRP